MNHQQVLASITGPGIDSDTLYVAVGSGGVILTSPDTVTWTSRTSGTSNILLSVIYAGGQYIAAGSNIILSSTDAISWTTVATPSSTIYDIAYSSSLGMYVAAASGSGGSNDIFTSTDGSTWTARTYSGITSNFIGFYCASWDGTQFTLGGQDIPSPDRIVIATSTDGITWTTSSIDSAQGYLDSMLWDGTQLLSGGVANVSGTNRPTIYLGSTRYLISTSNRNATFDIAYSGSVYCVVTGGSLDNPAVYYSTNATSWTESAISLTSPDSLNRVLYDGTKFLAVGLAGQIYVSSDANTWTARTSGISTALYGLCKS